jgi:hypothetical protein
VFATGSREPEPERIKAYRRWSKRERWEGIFFLPFEEEDRAEDTNWCVPWKTHWLAIYIGEEDSRVI